MYLSPAHRILLQRSRPDVKVFDVRSDTADSTAYTFTAVNIGDLGTAMNVAASELTTQHALRSTSNRQIAVICHSEAAAVTWTVSSCTIGGVAGIKVVDRGGASVAVNTAIFLWPSATLSDITNTDVVVTHSKAVTSCAIGVLNIDNFIYARNSGLGTGSAVSTLGSAIQQGGSTTTAENGIPNSVLIGASTHSTGLEAAQWGLRNNGQSGNYAPVVLYADSNAEMGFTAAWAFTPGYPSLGVTASGQFPYVLIDWSGAGTFDLAVTTIV